MVFSGVYPECHGSISEVLLECIRSVKMDNKDLVGLYMYMQHVSSTNRFEHKRKHIFLPVRTTKTA